MPKKVHWVDKYLPARACPEAVVKARKYPDPQSAWDAWDNGGDLLWVLQMTYGDPVKRALCACDIAESVLPIFERATPEDWRPREVIKAARVYMLEPTEANKRRVYDGIRLAYAALDAVGFCGAGDAAQAAIFAAYAAYGTVNVAYADNAAYHAYRATDDATERKAQADIVRKYFPTAPISAERRDR